MCALESIPPEAFTNQELSAAVEWRQSQSDYIRELTKTPETLMSIYKRILRHGDSSLGAHPNLQNEIGRSDDGRSDDDRSIDNRNDNGRRDDRSAFVRKPQLVQSEWPNPEKQNESNRPSTFTQQLFNLAQTEKEVAEWTQKSPPTSKLMDDQNIPQKTCKDFLDPQSSESLDAVRASLNLSSDDEALRVLIKMGYCRLKDIL